jgi:2-oxoglutarate dehydrogenase E1 component
MQKDPWKDLQHTSFLNAENASYLEQLYEAYLKNTPEIKSEWQDYFAQVLNTDTYDSEPFHSEIQTEFRELARRKIILSSLQVNPIFNLNKQDGQTAQHERKQTSVYRLVDAYRLLGHLQAAIDPLNLRQKALVPELMLSYYHLSEKDLNSYFEADFLPGEDKQTLKDIITTLETMYCGTIASEFMHIPDSPERVWVQQRVEALTLNKPLSNEIKLHILEQLIAAEGHEKYLGAKYPGAKRFSLEGSDSLIVALDELIRKAGTLGAQEIVIGMAHRGRLNVLVNILGKNPSQLFDEFEGKQDKRLESGDVKYHQGFSSNIDTAQGTLHLSLAFNPSHLEIVIPVMSGSVRARQEGRKKDPYAQVLPIAIHGDAAFAGQGVVMETLNMSKTRGYGIGGTVHIIVNNQIGFTTSRPHDARSTLYCSDIGKMIEIPIFHVNADDPEAVFKVVQLSLEYREKFKKDVIVDLVGYRRHGHNEADEPAVTQPGMYTVIKQLPTVCKLYGDRLVLEGVVQPDQIDELTKHYRARLDQRQSIRVLANSQENGLTLQLSSKWDSYVTNDWRVSPSTAVSLSLLQSLAEKINTLPTDFKLHPRVQKIIDDRRKMTEQTALVDWGYGEIMAYATLLHEGYSVRISGQDVARGTFFHRHLRLHNQTDYQEYSPLNHLSETQGAFSIYDSLLSEAAVLAFEYGYSTTDPKNLVIWEAQFGDFANGAQVVIDQFISSGEQKWGRLSGLTLFLPHGYEGQGPEHSSARLERFLQLCAEHNLQICVPTTPAQVFHMLRRQLLRTIRKPLIVMTPKSLLRHKLAVSTLTELSEGQFLPVIPEMDTLEISKVNRVILCCGKVYYELLERRRRKNLNSVAIIRIEQLYPFPEIELKMTLEGFSQVKDIVWCQEEPQNQGAWYGSQHHLLACLKGHQALRYAGRKPSAAPAVGYIHLHQEQQEALLTEALE